MTRRSLPPDGGLGFPTFRGLHITPKILKPVRYYTIWSKKRFILLGGSAAGAHHHFFSASSSLIRASIQRVPCVVSSFFQNGASVFK